MEGQWTFSNLDVEWVHDTYNTKEEAVEAAKDAYEDEESCYVGQLEQLDRINYKVINQDKVKFS